MYQKHASPIPFLIYHPTLGPKPFFVLSEPLFFIGDFEVMVNMFFWTPKKKKKRDLNLPLILFYPETEETRQFRA